MSTPPNFKDIAKASKDLHAKQFNFGQVKAEVTTKSSSGTEFKATGTRSAKSGDISGEVESTFHCCEKLKLTEKWTTDNVLSVEAEAANYVSNGVTLTAESAFSPYTSSKSLTLAGQFKNASVNVKGTLDVFKGPTFTGAAVFAYGSKVLVGYEGAYNVESGKVSKNDLALAVIGPDYKLTTVANGKTLEGAVFHKVNPKVDFGAKMTWAHGEASGGVVAALAAKFSCCDKGTASAKVKVDTKGQLGVSYTEDIRPGVTATLSGLLAGGSDANKLGLALTFKL